MEFIAECKLMGEGYAGGFSCGMSMAGSQTAENLVKVKTSEEKNKKITLWKEERGYEVRVFEEKEDQATRVYTEFKNNSEKEVVMEMLASFALKGIKADKIHRLQSFWSAEAGCNGRNCRQGFRTMNEKSASRGKLYNAGCTDCKGKLSCGCV